jgi:hypothetical protein
MTEVRRACGLKNAGAEAQFPEAVKRPSRHTGTRRRALSRERALVGVHEPADAVLDEAHVCGQGIAHDEKRAAVEMVRKWAGGRDGGILRLQPPLPLASHARKLPGKSDDLTLQAFAKRLPPLVDEALPC